MAISKPVIFHIFYNLKPSACCPYQALYFTAGTVFDLVYINKQTEIQCLGMNGSSNFQLKDFLKLLRYQLLRNADDYYQSTGRHIAEHLNLQKHSCDNFK